jgi:hypothetical protein
MVPCRFEPFGLHAAFEGIFPFKPVGRQVAQDGQIFRAMVFADAAVVFSESYIQAPVQAVFDAPGFSDGLGDVLMKVFLIVFDLDDIIGLAGDNRLGDFFLAPHGVNRDHGTPQGQGFDQSASQTWTGRIQAPGSRSRRR